MLEIPPNPGAITAAWLTSALKENGVIDHSVVLSFEKCRIGEDEGFTGGGLTRLTIEYDQAESSGPSSLIAKFAPVDPETRALMNSLNGREARFYSDFASQFDLPFMRCFYVNYNAVSGECILLLEDLGAYKAVEFIKGATEEQAKQAINALAHIHARWWNSPQLETVDGLGLAIEFPFTGVWEQYRRKVAEVLPEFAVPDRFFSLGDTVAEHEMMFFGQLFEKAPITLIHRDCHIDNILFGQQPDHKPAIVFDWQLSGKGRGVYDIAYFLIGSVPTETRRQIEHPLVRHYHNQLILSGVEGYSFEQCWFDYRFSALGKLFVTVGATVNVDNSTPFKKAWRQADLERLIAFCEDHSINTLLEQF